MLDEFNKNGKDTVTLSSLGEAITKSVTIAEIVKHRVTGLHQVNEISTIVIDDEYEPIEEGLEKMTVSRKLTCLQIILSKKAPADKTVPGYQEPIPDSEVHPEAGPEDDARRQNPRRGGGGQGRRPNTTRPRENDDGGNVEEEKKMPAANANNEGGRGPRRNRRGGGQRGGSGDNRRGGGRQGGGDRQGQPQAAQAEYIPFAAKTPGKGGNNEGANAGGQQQQPSGGRRGGRDGGNRGGGDRGDRGDGGQRSARRGGGGLGGQAGHGGRGVGSDPYAAPEHK